MRYLFYHHLVPSIYHIWIYDINVSHDDGNKGKEVCWYFADGRISWAACYNL